MLVLSVACSGGLRSLGHSDAWTSIRGLTLELSRPVAGRRTRASVAQSTRLTPRHGVGLNNLLGAKEPGENETPAPLPKAEARTHERAP